MAEGTRSAVQLQSELDAALEHIRRLEAAMEEVKLQQSAPAETVVAAAAADGVPTSGTDITPVREPPAVVNAAARQELVVPRVNVSV